MKHLIIQEIYRHNSLNPKTFNSFVAEGDRHKDHIVEELLQKNIEMNSHYDNTMFEQKLKVIKEDDFSTINMNYLGEINLPLSEFLKLFK
jgi:hypothetical protein